MEKMRKEQLENIESRCSRCGACAEDCELLQSQGPGFYGDLARALLDGVIDDALQNFFLECSLCGLCQELCPENLDILKMIRRTRQAFLESKLTDDENYRFLWVDHDWNYFSLYRKAYGLDDRYKDLIKDRCDILFFPGCMLSNMGPRLVESACGWIGRSSRKSVGILVDCCGAPLYQIGLRKRFDDYTNRLRRSILNKKARQVVTACPTCHERLVKAFPQGEVRVVSLFESMSKTGLQAKPCGSGKITIHDSCTDRSGTIGSYVRKLLGGFEIVEMPHNGPNTICCGSGGIVSAINPEICSQRAQERIGEVEDTGADICATYCMSCAHRLSAEGGAAEVRHILELVFDQWVDQERFEQRNGDMWQGETGENNMDLLLQSEVIKE